MTLKPFLCIPDLLKFSESAMKVRLVLLTFICSVYCQNTTEGLSDSYNYENTTVEKTLEASNDVVTIPPADSSEDNISANETSESSLTDTENSTRANKVSCSCNNTLDSSIEPKVQLVNGSTYQTLIFGEHNTTITNRSQPAICSVTLFYAPWCDFSAAAAPHYNALARVFPQLR